MLPILQRELADQREWLTEEELMDYYAIGQCTPGIIALNVATFTGRKRGGDLGGVVATAGFILPSLCIIIALAGVITSVEHLKWVQNAFAGIRACICVQILNAVIRLAEKGTGGYLDRGDFCAGVCAGSLRGCLAGVVRTGLCRGGTGDSGTGNEDGCEMIYLQLFLAYFKVGLFAIGGGMATIPFLYDLSDKTGWFTHAQLADMLAVSESTPGRHRREYGDLCGICDSRNSRSGGSYGGAGFAVDHCDFAYCTVFEPVSPQPPGGSGVLRIAARFGGSGGSCRDVGGHAVSV